VYDDQPTRRRKCDLLLAPHRLPMATPAAAEGTDPDDGHDGDRDPIHQHGHNLMPRRAPIAVSPARGVR
jgi:hypothetical protein